MYMYMWKLYHTENCYTFSQVNKGQHKNVSHCKLKCDKNSKKYCSLLLQNDMSCRWVSLYQLLQESSMKFQKNKKWNSAISVCTTFAQYCVCVSHTFIILDKSPASANSNTITSCGECNKKSKIIWLLHDWVRNNQIQKIVIWFSTFFSLRLKLKYNYLLFSCTASADLSCTHFTLGKEQ